MAKASAIVVPANIIVICRRSLYQNHNALNFLNILLILFTGLAFLFYGVYYFFSPNFKLEFKRFGLQKFGLLAAWLQILGGTGLLVGLTIHFILVISTLGLAVLMLLGVATRIKVKDNFQQTFPALFFMIINFYLFLVSLHVIG